VPVPPRVLLTLTSSDLERERLNLERGSVAGPGVEGLDRGAFCDLELVFPSGARLTVAARAVLATAATAAFAFERWDREALARELAAPASAQPPASAPTPPPAGEPLAEPEETPSDPAHASLHDQLRGLSVVEQLRVARDGSITERTVLERLYGKTVWEALLRNSRVTVPEVSRLARMGTMPRPLLELILGNPAWMQVPQIRRALLSNPRLSAEMVHRVLILLPRDELQLVPQITAYPAPVRMAAKGMVKR
jgi:hypothetical protein